MSRSRPIVIAQSVLTGLGILFSATIVASVFDPQIVALGALAVLAAKGGFDFYIAATTTPTAQVLATQPVVGGDVIAGPRSSFTTGAAIEPQNTVGEIT